LGTFTNNLEGVEPTDMRFKLNDDTKSPVPTPVNDKSRNMSFNGSLLSKKQNMRIQKKITFSLQPKRYSEANKNLDGLIINPNSTNFFLNFLSPSKKNCKYYSHFNQFIRKTKI
jgi:nitrogen regulatory protein PII-like uncharacterized protein